MENLSQISERYGPQPLLMVVPCFNEESRFDPNYFQELCSIGGTFWFFVDDGSTDATSDILTKFCIKKNAKLLNLPKNVGKSEAIRRGLLKALSEYPNSLWCGFIDSDGAFDSKETEDIFLGLKNSRHDSHQAFFSSRVKLSGRKIHRKIHRHLIGRFIATVFGFIWKDIPYDTQSGFKIFRNDSYFRESISVPFVTRWFFDMEIILRITSKQNRAPIIWEEPLNSWTDISGSKISAREKLRIAREIPSVILLLAQNRNHLNKR